MITFTNFNWSHNKKRHFVSTNQQYFLQTDSKICCVVLYFVQFVLFVLHCSQLFNFFSYERQGRNEYAYAMGILLMVEKQVQ